MIRVICYREYRDGGGEIMILDLLRWDIVKKKGWGTTAHINIKTYWKNVYKEKKILLKKY